MQGRKVKWWNVLAVLAIVVLVFDKLQSFPWESLDLDNGGLAELPYSALYLLGYGLVVSYLFLKEAGHRD